MSVALIIRNINPDRDPNTELLVVTLDANHSVTAELGLTPYPNTMTSFNPQGQVYWFPRVTQAEDHGVFLNDEGNHCHAQDHTDDDYLWFCELDQAV
ncbi:MAG: hypothetical protein EOO69_09470 [Moraxellaceae bacterium]|nr:MAG: hypothetical protein EOO69_09470 [Moraxellaceae bacterium]